MARVRFSIEAGTLCVGPCKRPLRPNATTLAEAPGTIVHSKGGMCLTCTRHDGGESTAARKARLADDRSAGLDYAPLRKRGSSRDITTLLLCVNLNPETVTAARANVTRWFPGDTEILDILGMTA